MQIGKEIDYIQDNLLEEYKKKEYKFAIYSEQTILLISCLFSTIFGVLLLMQNLKDIGKHKDAKIALIFSILFSIVIILIGNIPFVPSYIQPFILNFLGGIIITKYYFKKHFRNLEDYSYKKIWKPLIISTLISTIIALILIFILKLSGRV